MRRILLACGTAAALAAGACVAGCDGLADIPDDRIICCQTGDVFETKTRIDCVWNPEGRVVAYALCPDAGPPVDDAGAIDDAALDDAAALGD